MNGYLLDTSVVVDYLHGSQVAVNLVDSLDLPINSSFVVLCELFEGVFRVESSEKEIVQTALKRHFSSYQNVYGLDATIAEKFGQLRASLKISGQVIEDLDILIGATCLVNDQILVTKNAKHFQRIDGLSVKAL